MSSITLYSVIPGPMPLPIVGWLGNAVRYFRDPIGYMQYLHTTYGDLAALVAGSQRNLFSGRGSKAGGTIFAFGPDYNREVLTNTAVFHTQPFNDPSMPYFRYLSSGLFAFNNEEHKKRRRLLMPLFHKAVLGRYRERIVTYTQQMLNQWQVGEERDILREMRQLTLAIANSTLFGIRSREDVVNIGEMGYEWSKRTLSPGWLVPLNFPGTPYYRLMKHSERLIEAIQEMIWRKRTQQQEGDDIFTMLIQARDEAGWLIDDEELIGHANVLFIAGHETTANALTWTLFLLAQHPEVMADLLDEVGALLQGEPPTAEQLDRMPLLTHVIQESLRLLPPIASLNRVVAAPGQLGTYVLNTGMEVIYSPFITHRLPALYDHPNRFWPQRWEKIAPGPYDYLPFGAGPRLCLGMHFAVMQLKIVLTMILQQYRLQMRPQATIDYRAVVILSPKHDMPMYLQPQDRDFEKSKGNVKGSIQRLVDFNK